MNVNVVNVKWIERKREFALVRVEKCSQIEIVKNAHSISPLMKIASSSIRVGCLMCVKGEQILYRHSMAVDATTTTMMMIAKWYVLKQKTTETYRIDSHSFATIHRLIYASNNIALSVILSLK